MDSDPLSTTPTKCFDHTIQRTGCQGGPFSLPRADLDLLYCPLLSIAMLRQLFTEVVTYFSLSLQGRTITMEGLLEKGRGITTPPQTIVKIGYQWVISM